jgi:hypothetical protein
LADLTGEFEISEAGKYLHGDYFVKESDKEILNLG